MEAELAFPSGTTGRIVSAMRGDPERVISLVVEGERGRLEVANPLAPQLGNLVRLGDHREVVTAEPSTYAAQLDAVVAALRTGAPVPTEGEDSVATMTVIDACYLAAGLQPRA
jgi:predicted dehydrogenase